MSIEPRTIQVGITPGASSTASYTLAPGLIQYVQSVYVEIETAGAGAVRPTLTVSEQAGVVIQKVRQGEPIPGSSTGSATWALRLTGSTLAGAATTGIFFDIDNIGGRLNVETTGNGGLVLYADTPGILSLGADDDIRMRSFGDMNVTVTGTLEVDPTTFQGGATTWQYTVGTGGISWSSRGDVSYSLTAGSGSFNITIPTGANVEVQDHNGNPIFRVNEDGSLQGKTGQTLTFDL